MMHSTARTPVASLIDHDGTWSRRLTVLIVIAATIYQAVLCLVHTHLFRTPTALVALSEFGIYVLCLLILMRYIQLEFIALFTLVAAYLLLMALMRGYLDPKGFRDIIIPLLFYWLGRTVGDIRFADRILKIIIVMVLALGFFELFFVDLFMRVFNVFSYYIAQGNINTTTNWAKGSVLALNSIRPEGIGRSILPGILGSHRVSSVFLEPVSLGNFAVIVASWGLSKGRDELRSMLLFVGAAIIMITFADSRYGMVAVALIAIARFTLVGRANLLVMIMPVACAILLVLVGMFYDGHYGDNIPGRLYSSGVTLLHFGASEIFGLAGFNINFGDMGYSIILTRFGIVLCAVLWITLWLVRMSDERGVRFRTSIAIYMSLILCISGTSLFALKSAGILWFLIGCCALRNAPQEAGKSARADSDPFLKKVSYAD